MEFKPTFKDARKYLRDTYNMILRRKDGEYMVNFVEVKTATATAYYTDDLLDAVNTAILMRSRDTELRTLGVKTNATDFK